MLSQLNPKSPQEDQCLRTVMRYQEAGGDGTRGAWRTKSIFTDFLALKGIKKLQATVYKKRDASFTTEVAHTQHMYL